jgi:hypothetical protein
MKYFHLVKDKESWQYFMNRAMESSGSIRMEKSSECYFHNKNAATRSPYVSVTSRNIPQLHVEIE